MTDKSATTYVVSVFEKPHWRTILTSSDEGEAEAFEQAMVQDGVKIVVQTRGSEEVQSFAPLEVAREDGARADGLEIVIGDATIRVESDVAPSLLTEASGAVAGPDPDGSQGLCGDAPGRLQKRSGRAGGVGARHRRRSVLGAPQCLSADATRRNLVRRS